MNSPVISWYYYQAFSFAWIGIALLIFVLLLFVTAPYGRHSSFKWGPMLDNRVGWMIMELPVLLVLFLLIWPAGSSLQSVSLTMIGLFSIHYLNRIFVFPLRLKTDGKKMPLIIVGSGVCFNLINGFSLGYYFSHFGIYPVDWFVDWRFIIGVVIFFIGMYINLKADNKLIALRRPGETHYLIPHGWLFKYISCPNLFGELVEWAGFALLCWNLPALSFLIWTAANLIPRAISHHKWYKKHFDIYPENRKAILPFII